MFGLTKESISENKLLGHISMAGTSGACLDLELFLQLNANLAKGNKFIFFPWTGPLWIFYLNKYRFIYSE